MGTIIINNLSKQKDYKTVRLASTILAGYYRESFLAQEAAKQQAQKDAEAAAKKAAEELKAAQEKAAAAEEKRRSAEAEAEKARWELEEARTKIKMASPDVTAFKTMFDALQGQIAKIRELLGRISAEDPATAEKLGRALAAVAAQLTTEG